MRAYIPLFLTACAVGGVPAPSDLETGDCASTSEQCNGIDDDCDGEIDEGVAFMPTWYADADGDTFGNEDESTEECFAPTGYVEQTGDCNDEDATINPAAGEVGNNSVDEDCDGDVDATCGPNAPVVIVNSARFDPEFMFFDSIGPGFEVETTVDDSDGDLWVVNTELWIDTSADGVVDTSASPTHEYTPFEADPDDTCSEIQLNHFYVIEADAYVALGAVDVALRTADSQGHWSETVVVTIEW